MVAAALGGAVEIRTESLDSAGFLFVVGLRLFSGPNGTGTSGVSQWLTPGIVRTSRSPGEPHWRWSALMDGRTSRSSRQQFLLGAAGLGLLAGCGRLPWQAPP